MRFLCASLALLMTVQGGDPAEATRSELRRIGKGLEAGGTEPFAEELIQLRLDLRAVGDREVVKDLDDEIVGLMKKSDPLFQSALYTCKRTANGLTDLAGRYRKRSWKRSASELCELAELLQPGIAREQLSALRPEPRLLSSAELWKEAEEVSDLRGWKPGEDGVTTPVPKPDGEAILLAKDELVPGWTLGFIGRIDPEQGGSVGVVFGYQDLHHYHRLNIDRDRDRTQVAVDKVEGGSFTTLLEVETDIPAEAYEKGIPVEIGLVDDRLRVVVGRLAPRVIRLDSPYLTGRIGLRHSPGSLAVAPVRYERTKLSVD